MSVAVWVGAPGPGGLALPAAQPTLSQLYAPRGIAAADGCLVVVDSGNHRVLLWHGLPSDDHASADVVLGQPTPFTEGPRAGGRGAENGFHLPTGVGLWDGKLFLADAWHHRVLVWNEVPTTHDRAPDWVLGQADLASVEPNRGGGVSASGLYWPYGLGFIDGWFYVTDTGNRRVLGWEGLPEHDRPADLVLGQPNAQSADENRGGPPNAGSFRWPHAVAGGQGRLYVADAGNHRVLGWSRAPREDGPADVVLGQPGFDTALESQYAPQSARSLRFPYALASDGERLVVADTANNRLLLWQELPESGQPADAVLGQPDFVANGENRWRAVERDTLCWPYGLFLSAGRLGVADSGNNRAMLWQLEEEHHVPGRSGKNLRDL